MRSFAWLVGFAFAIVLSAPLASAFPVGDGVVLASLDGRSLVTIQTGSGIDVQSLTFDETTGGFSLDGLTVTLGAGSGYGNWSLVHLDATRLELTGSLTAPGSIRVTGPARSYFLEGVSPLGAGLTISGSDGATFPLAAGAHDVVITTAPTSEEGIVGALNGSVPLMLGLLMLGLVLLALGGVSLAAQRR